MNTDKFTVKVATDIHLKLVKVANDMLEQAAAPAAPEAAGNAGPQEVVDALEGVINDLTAVSAAIPAEPSNASPEVGVEAPVEEPSVEAPIPEPVEEEELKLAKELAAVTAKLDKIERETIATQFAELFEEPKVQQAKYDEVIASDESLSIWTAKIDSIEQFKTQQTGAPSNYKPAQTTTSWLKPRSKVAKLGSNEMVNL